MSAPSTSRAIPRDEKPSTLTPLPDQMPGDLCTRDRWVVWRWESNGSGPTKPPYDPISGRRASTASRDTWASHTVAVQRLAAGGFDGVGYVLTGDEGLVGVDLDHCRDPKTGTLTPAADALVRRLNSYAEATPSGTGVRIFVYGALPGPRCKLGDVEMYRHSRFLSLTGHRLPGTPAGIEHRPEEIAALYRETFGASGPEQGSDTAERDASPMGPQDEALVGRLRASDDRFALLWEGRWREALNASGGPYPSQSEADLAFCTILANAGADSRQVDRLVRASGLMRAKWSGPFGARTLERATGGSIPSNRLVSSDPVEPVRTLVAEAPGMGHAQTLGTLGIAGTSMDATSQTVLAQWTDTVSREFTYADPAHALTVTASGVSEIGRAVHAYVTVKLRGTIVKWGDLNLANVGSRRAFVESLERRPSDSPIPWAAIFEEFCREVTRRYLASGEVVALNGTEWTGPTHFVSPILPVDEPTVVFADGASCKGFLALLLAFAAMNPGVTLPGGIRAGVGGGVLYLDWESSARRLDHRVHRMATALGLGTNGRLHYLNMSGRCLAKAMPRVRDLCRQHQIRLVVVDSLMPATMGANPDPTVAAVETMTQLGSLGTEGVSVVAIAHVTKAGAKKASTGIFGSAFFRNLARSTWQVTTDKPDSNTRVLMARHQKVNDGREESPVSVTFTFEPSGLIGVAGGSAPPVTLPGIVHQVLRAALNGDGPGEIQASIVHERVGEAAQGVDVERKRVTETLARATERGYLTRRDDPLGTDAIYTRGPAWEGWIPGEKGDGRMVVAGRKAGRKVGRKGFVTSDDGAA